MNVRRNKEIKAVVTALTVAAALASGFLTVRDANAAPPSKKKSTVTVKRATKAKPVYVKMSGNRRAAEVRAQQLYSQALAQKAADEEAATVAQQTSTDDTTGVAASSSQAQTGVVNPYGGFVQQVNVPGFGGQGPVVVGNSYGVGGITVGGFSGPSYPAGGYGFGNAGGIGYPSSIFFNSFNNGGSVFGSGLPYGTGFPSGF